MDGNEYRDFLCNYTSLILGHAHPDVVAAVEAQVRRGSAFAAPTETEVELAEEIRRRVPSIERLRFTSSGTEATMFAIRAARAFTGRPLIAKFERVVSRDPRRGHGRDARRARGDGRACCVGCRGATPTASRPSCAAGSTTWRRSSSSPSRAPAACVPPEDGFLGWLRDLADRAGALLIFDEIISFRVAPGGAQERFGVRPDLTTLGKIIGSVAAIRSRRSAAAPTSWASSTRGGRARSAMAARSTAARSRRPRASRPCAPSRPTRTRGSTTSASACGRRVAATIARDGLDARVTAVGSLFQVFPGAGSGPAPRPSRRASPAGRASSSPSSSTASTSPPAGWARSRPIASESDVDDLADAIGRALATLAETRAAEPATA